MGTTITHQSTNTNGNIAHKDDDTNDNNEALTNTDKDKKNYSK